MSQTITTTRFHFPRQKDLYIGKVRDVYTMHNNLLIMIATDRISAFDVVLPKGIPYKGQILNQIAVKTMRATQQLVPNWFIASPDPNVAIGYHCIPFKIEMVIRGYLCGHAARVYKKGERNLCGVVMPDGMKENDKFPEPIITPATKAEKGAHDEDISYEDILKKKLLTAADYQQLETYTKLLFQHGTEMAAKRGLILADTKYEFGKTQEGRIVLIDEIHTPDSSRYFYAEGYQERQYKGEPQKQLSKEFVRQWLLNQGFEGKEGQKIPEMSKTYVAAVSARYIELYEHIMGEPFIKADTNIIHKRIEQKVSAFLEAWS